MSTHRSRFGMTAEALPKNAAGKTFFAASPGYKRLKRGFDQLLDERGLGVLTADPGVGKTTAMRQLCGQLPRPDHLVLYICDTAVAPLDLYRTLAVEMGVKPSHRRSQLWLDIKNALTHKVDEQGVTPVIVIDEAQHLSDRFLIDLSGFLNFTFDSRDLLCLWLVGLTPLRRHLRMQQHAALQSRVAVQVHLEPLDRTAMTAMIDFGLNAAGVTRKILSDSALEMILRSSCGLPREASKILKAALRTANESGQDFLDDAIVTQVLDERAADGAHP